MEICMSVTVKAVIPDNEVVPTETLVQAIKEQHMDAKIVEAIIAALEEEGKTVLK
jgi:hypothetical protein